MRRRWQLLEAAEKDPELRAYEIEACRRSVVHLCNNWAWTYDPRNAGTALPSLLPFDLWPKQEEFMHWLDALVLERRARDGLVEKSRDSGFTWLAAAWAWHKWRFVQGFDVAFGSRITDLVDKVGDPDTIFQKIRQFQSSLPVWLRPKGFFPSRHDNYLRLVNPENGNIIKGQGGDNMGRGGRVKVYFVDEAGFLQHAESVDKATSATASTRVWGSTVNGIGNLFHQKRFGGKIKVENIFIFDVSDDPRKTPEIIQELKDSMEEHVYASEYGRDYSASVEGICIPGKYVDAAMEIADLLAAKGRKIEPAARGIGGLDVGGGGKAKSVAIARFGPVVTPPTSWGDPDTNETAERCLDYAEQQRPRRSDGTECVVSVVNYDSVGVGAGALTVMKKGRRGLHGVGINVGLPPSTRTWPDKETSEEKFGNLKAELWFIARERFKATYEMKLFLEGKKGGQEHPLSDLISLPPVSAGKDCNTLKGQISSVKWFRNEKGKIVIETKAQLAARGIASPDHAEALILTMQENSVVDTWRRAFGPLAGVKPQPR